MQAAGEKLEILAYLLQQHEDTRMPTLFTTSNAEQTGIGTNNLYWWATKERREMTKGGEREIRLKTSTKNLMNT